MNPLTGLLLHRMEPHLAEIGAAALCALTIVLGILLLGRRAERLPRSWQPATADVPSAALDETGEPLSPRELRIADLERAFWTARRRGDIAQPTRSKPSCARCAHRSGADQATTIDTVRRRHDHRGLDSYRTRR